MTVQVALACAGDVEAQLRAALQQDTGIAVRVLRGREPDGPGPPPADVLVIDLESLGAAALDVIQDVMQSRPVPVLALCAPGGQSPTAAEALSYGAVDAISRRDGLATQGLLLRRRVHLVSGVSVVRRRQWRPAPPTATTCGTVVAVAASTGGPAALATLLTKLGGLAAPVLLVQHLHSDFMRGFVSWLGGFSALPVTEATHGEPARNGHVYVAPAERHLRLAADRSLALAELPVTVHRPSADELFSSVATAAGPAGIGVLLTGMGRDGAAGLLAMRRAGAYTVVQDEASCAVFGMPAAALEVGAAGVSGSPDRIAGMVLSVAQRRTR